MASEPMDIDTGQRHASQSMLNLPFPQEVRKRIYFHLLLAENAKVPARSGGRSSYSFKLDILRVEMCREWSINACNKLRHPPHTALDPGLRKNVVVLYPVEQPTETPERVRLDCVQCSTREGSGVERFRVRVDAGRQEDLEEGRCEVVDALDVAAGWVSDGPDVEDAFKGAFGGFVAV